MIDDSIKLYLKEIQQYPLLSPEEEKILINKALQRDLEAKNKLIQCNLRLAVSIAKKYINEDIPFLDLVQEANLGLIKAIEKFDINRNVRFSTCASWYIKQAILRAIENKSKVIRVPSYISENIQKIKKIEQQLTTELNRAPTIEEISNYSGIPVEKIKICLDQTKEIISLDIPIGEDDEGTLEELIADNYNTTPEEYLINKSKKELLQTILNTLTKKESQIISYRYGLDTNIPKTLEETGAKFGLTKERIRQIENKALRKLRNPIRTKMLKEVFST